MLNRDELNIICRENYVSVYNFCLSRLRDDSAAADVTQDVFLALSEKSENLENINIRAWLFGAAALLIKKEFSKKHRSQKTVNFDEATVEFEKISVQLEENMIRENLGAYAVKIIARLSSKEKALFYLRYADGLSCAQIGDRIGKSENAVYASVSRLRKKIIGYVSDEIWFA